MLRLIARNPFVLLAALAATGCGLFTPEQPPDEIPTTLATGETVKGMNVSLAAEPGTWVPTGSTIPGPTVTWTAHNTSPNPLSIPPCGPNIIEITGPGGKVIHAVLAPPAAAPLVLKADESRSFTASCTLWLGEKGVNLCITSQDGAGHTFGDAAWAAGLAEGKYRLCAVLDTSAAPSDTLRAWKQGGAWSGRISSNIIRVQISRTLDAAARVLLAQRAAEHLKSAWAFTNGAKVTATGVFGDTRLKVPCGPRLDVGDGAVRLDSEEISKQADKLAGKVLEVTGTWQTAKVEEIKSILQRTGPTDQMSDLGNACLPTIVVKTFRVVDETQAKDFKGSITPAK